jgi:tRNA pseudouridine38-40 synthase
VRNIRIVVEYDGRAYVGWQVQDSGPSIQGELQKALASLTGETPHIQAAGRTDAGVHALAQVANFHTSSRIPADRFAAALNSKLPADICVHRAEKAPDDFDARHSAHSKRYRYRIYQGEQRAALESGRAWHVRPTLDLEAMRAGAAHLLGEKDFESFRSAQCDAEHGVRMMYSIDIARIERPPAGSLVDLTFHANAFCRHMVRIMTGTLVEVGLGKRPADEIARLLTARDRRQAGITAPAEGLTLLEVIYKLPPSVRH